MELIKLRKFINKRLSKKDECNKQLHTLIGSQLNSKDTEKLLDALMTELQIIEFREELNGLKRNNC